MKTALFAILCGLPAYAAVYDLPRSHAELEVRALVECLDPDGCDVARLCLSPSEWASEEHGDFQHLQSLEYGGLLQTDWVGDETLACALRVEGVANVAGEKGHGDGYGTHFARETVDLHRIRSAVGEFEHRRVPLDPAMPADCRPATWSGECADAVHLDGPECPNGEPAWHVYVEDRFDGERDPYDGTMVPRAAVPEGELMRLTAKARAPTDWMRRYFWRVEHGRWNDDVWDDMEPYREIQYRAPRVAADATETITLTVEARGYCATTTIEFTVLDDG